MFFRPSKRELLASSDFLTVLIREYGNKGVQPYRLCEKNVCIKMVAWLRLLVVSAWCLHSCFSHPLTNFVTKRCRASKIKSNWFKNLNLPFSCSTNRLKLRKRKLRLITDYWSELDKNGQKCGKNAKKVHSHVQYLPTDNYWSRFY